MLASVVPVNVSVSAESKVMPANPVGKTSYGQRSMGDQRRHSPERPRELEAGDGREDQKPKVTRILKSQSFGPNRTLLPLSKRKNKRV